MKLAHDVLKVGDQNSVSIIRRKKFIISCSKLCSYGLINTEGVTITPLEIRLEENKLKFIEHLLQTQKGAYKHPHVILSLTEGLDDSLENNIKGNIIILGLLINAAISFNDFEEAYKIAKTDEYLQNLSLNENEEDPRWKVFLKLGSDNKWNDINEKLNCLNQALKFCPDNELENILTNWTNLENLQVNNLKPEISISIPKHKESYDSSTPSDALSSLLSPSLIESQTRNFLSGGLRALKSVSPMTTSQNTSRAPSNTNFPINQTSINDSTKHNKNNENNENNENDNNSKFNFGIEEKLTRGVGWLIGAD